MLDGFDICDYETILANNLTQHLECVTMCKFLLCSRSCDAKIVFNPFMESSNGNILLYVWLHHESFFLYFIFTSNGCCGCKKKLPVSARRRVAMVDRGPRAATAMAMARLPLSLSLFSSSPPLFYLYYIRSTVHDWAGRRNPSLFQTPT